MPESAPDRYKLLLGMYARRLADDLTIILSAADAVVIEEQRAAIQAAGERAMTAIQEMLEHLK